MAVLPGTFLPCLVTTLLVLATQSLGVSIQSDIISKCNNATGPDDHCSIAGERRLLWTGVRIGIYSSWFASWVSNSSLLDAREICRSLDSNASFLFAIAVVVATYSTLGNIRIIDALILLLLSFGYLLSVMTLWGNRTVPTKRNHFGGWGTHFRLVLVNAICAYGIWFWSVGMTDKLPQCNTREQCAGLKLWILVEVPIANAGIRNLVLAFWCILYSTMFLTAVVACMELVGEVSDDANWKDYRERFSWRLREKIARVEPWPLSLGFAMFLCIVVSVVSLVAITIKRPKGTRVSIGVLTFVWLVFAIASIEMTLQANHVRRDRVQTYIATAGQFIPLVIGGCTLLRALWKAGLLGLCPTCS
ncbi:hypothetical protein AYL99_02172 [Fonsecaea erecta]|uniref:Uncharacterized protein n=1 Tax=Fonsecaea erecta TaxID=1367422 RepID=A0A178ZV23_9EURO|nr:hypothetical protein AYL99_02172 [Fonsecaea erecta]OAP62945.1 hypothetical protein AYL99_02172 [Fonsecaea erecta]